ARAGHPAARPGAAGRGAADRDRPPVAGGPRPAAPGRGGAVATILIVEDEEPVRGLLGDILADARHRAVLALHGGEAPELAAKEPPDLVLADVMMPVLDGLEL